MNCGHVQKQGLAVSRPFPLDQSNSALGGFWQGLTWDYDTLLHGLFLNVNSEKLIILAGPHSLQKQVTYQTRTKLLTLSLCLSLSVTLSVLSLQTPTFLINALIPHPFLHLCAIPVPISSAQPNHSLPSTSSSCSFTSITHFIIPLHYYKSPFLPKHLHQQQQSLPPLQSITASLSFCTTLHNYYYIHSMLFHAYISSLSLLLKNNKIITYSINLRFNINGNFILHYIFIQLYVSG